MIFHFAAKVYDMTMFIWSSWTKKIRQNDKNRFLRENRVLIPKNKFDKQSYQEHLDHRLQVMLCLIYLTVCLLALGQMLKSMHECAERLCIYARVWNYVFPSIGMMNMQQSALSAFGFGYK